MAVTEFLTFIVGAGMLGLAATLGYYFARDRIEREYGERLTEVRRLLAVSQGRLSVVSEDNRRLRRLVQTAGIPAPKVPEWMGESR